MLKLRLLEQFSAAVCRKGRLVTTLAIILASTCIPRAHAQLNIGVSANPACPGATVNVSVINSYNTEGYVDELGVSGCTITNTDGQTYAYGYFTMPGQDNVEITAVDDNGCNSLTVVNGANIPASTNTNSIAGTVISNGVLGPANFIVCAVGSGITAPTNSGTVVRGTNITVIKSSCGNTISSNATPVPYTKGDSYFTWTSNGVLVTNIPAAFTNAGSYTFEGYVHFLPPPTNFGGITNVIPVDLGPLTVCVFYFTNICTPGSVSLTNTSAATNYILGVAPSLSVSTNATNAALEFKTNCPCVTSLNADITSNPPPIIVSNWWTVSGPGPTYANSGSGLSTGPLSPIPTNGGTGIATFYVSYATWTNSANSAPWCCTNTNSAQVPFNVLQMTLTNLAFTNGNHTICQDGTAQPYPSAQWTTNMSWPVCYTSSNPMTVMPIFSVSPSAFPLPVLVQGISSGPLLPLTTNSISGPNLALTITSTNNFHTNVDYLTNMTIDWQYSCDNGTNWCDAGTSTNRVYVTLNDPQATNLYQTVVHLACSVAGATTADAAVANTWSLFAGPTNVKTWNTNALLYYGTSSGGFNTSTGSLLAFYNGQCHAFASLFTDALLANGVTNVHITLVTPPTGQYQFGVNNIAYINASYTNAPYLYATSDLDITANGIPGQGMTTPLAKLFIRHFIVHYGTGSNYYDPSYGVAYSGRNDFSTNIGAWERTSDYHWCKGTGSGLQVTFTDQ